MKVNTKQMKKAMFLIFFAIAIWWLFDNYKVVINLLKILFEVMIPFMVAFAISFVLNKPMIFIEEKVFDRINFISKLDLKYKRAASLIITLLTFIIFLFLFLQIAIPNLVEASTQLAEQIPSYLKQLQTFLQNTSIFGLNINEWIESVDVENLYNQVTSFFKGGFLSIADSTFSVFSSVFGLFSSIFLGIVFSIYFLLQKEDLSLSIKKLTFAVLPREYANKLVLFIRIANESFSSFISGQSLDALLIGAIFFVSMTIFNFPYALMISIIIAIFALIPIIGAFIGLVVGAFLIFVQDPQKAFYFIILFFVIQQLEGDLIYPKVVGKASGLSSVWILAAVTIGGSLFGILGIILFVPMFSIIQKLLSIYIEKNSEKVKFIENKQ